MGAWNQTEHCALTGSPNWAIFAIIDSYIEIIGAQKGFQKIKFQKFLQLSTLRRVYIRFSTKF